MCIRDRYTCTPECVHQRLLPQVEDRRVRPLLHDAKQTYNDVSITSQSAHVVHTDMLDYQGALSSRTVLDLMERQRTELIGGQPMLEQLKRDGVLIVVHSITGMSFTGVPVGVHEQVLCMSGYQVRDDKYFCVHQRCTGAGGELLAEAGMMLVFVRDGGVCLLYTSPSPRDRTRSRMPSSALKKKILQINVYVICYSSKVVNKVSLEITNCDDI
eukprot:TRINITY_DN18237_c0_g1_i1.p1 TRINITY_DN18237_c0_g1~~TRINITY_DN18237_c0_g1_i1.p1  ORF type:complete len:214 (+),score=36.11 TRINITY_DN18237_c0_g1_i1:151-792(+)